MPEHTPLAERDIGNIQELFRGIPLSTVVEELIAEIREQRRLLRAVEWGGRTHEEPACPACGALENDIRPNFAEVRCHDAYCELGRYLAACAGKGEK